MGPESRQWLPSFLQVLQIHVILVKTNEQPVNKG